MDIAASSTRVLYVRACIRENDDADSEENTGAGGTRKTFLQLSRDIGNEKIASTSEDRDTEFASAEIGSLHLNLFLHYATLQ
jgi:hypothetical protein